MKIHTLTTGVIVSDIEDFSLEQTLDCGQCFRFSQTSDGGWHGVAADHPLTLRQTPYGIMFENITTDEFNGFWRRYFDLDRDYKAIRNSFPDHPALRQSACFTPGTRILRQDAWEALISFIISQNNNIKRIKGIIERICQNFGSPCGNDFAFPSPASLACLDEQELQILRAGWRSAYILDAAHKVNSGQLDLSEISVMPIEQARKALQTIRGVGPKVAECVLLYGMGRLEAFPLDVWMKRAMAQLFPEFTPESFGEYAGIAQQYIFHYCRCNPHCLEK
ncbi:MAG: DNA-3-methyladenine glycosylase [Oscillospiraceae bacterium]|nr:DNA-3-methyladenine glycosylase [Oscillospiraceae bacterium]MDD4413564.1 DNA-3-methyladenine glycosylase [Oscillospiraceae bacterium]